MVKKNYNLDVSALVAKVSQPGSREEAFRAFSRLVTGEVDTTDPVVARLIELGFITEIKTEP